MYHRIAEVSPDPWDLCVSPRHFVEHLDVLQQFGDCVTAGELLPQLSSDGKRPLFAVTFDDRYADNATVAGPILIERQMPATFFVVSDMTGTGEEFWWDALSRVFLLPGTLPERLELAIGEGRREWDLGTAVNLSEEELRSTSSWRAEDEVQPSARHSLYLEFWHLLFSMPPEERKRLTGELLEWAGLPGKARPTYAILDDKQFDALAAKPRFEIGGHSRTHASLPDLPLEEQLREIVEAKEALEDRTRRLVSTFSYPFGRFCDETHEAVRKAGFAAACTSRYGAVLRDTDPFAIPRLQVKDWDGNTFRRELINAFC
jgi:peptidoglycan/xylan/chitin deacetylase (PgdA/CDA1 family)